MVQWETHVPKAAAKQRTGELARVDEGARGAAHAVRNSKRAFGLIAEEGVLAALGRLARVRDAARAEEQVQAARRLAS